MKQVIVNLPDEVVGLFINAYWTEGDHNYSGSWHGFGNQIENGMVVCDFTDCEDR